MKTLLYIRGNPGVGKVTVARELEKSLGWKLLWFHDIKNAVYNVVQEHRIPRLMDAVTAPILNFLLERGDNVIYVRPSPDKETVENVRLLTAAHPDYRFLVVRLEASYQNLKERISERSDPYRITKTEELDAYLKERSMADIEGEKIVDTDGRSPAEVAEAIKEMLG